MASLGSDTTGDFYNGVPESTKEFIPDRLSLNLDSYEMYIPPASECVASVDDVMGFWEPPEAEEDDEDDEDDDQRCWLPPTVNDDLLFRAAEPQGGPSEPQIPPYWRIPEHETGGGCIDPSSLQLPVEAKGNSQIPWPQLHRRRTPMPTHTEQESSSSDSIRNSTAPLARQEDSIPTITTSTPSNRDREDVAEPKVEAPPTGSGTTNPDNLERNHSALVSSPESSVKSVPTSPELDPSDIYDMSSESENDPEVRMPIRSSRGGGGHGRKMTQQHRCDKVLHNGRPCLKSFTRPYDLARHQETIHARERKVFKCDKCKDNSKTFSRMDALSRHMRIKHPHGR